MPAGVHVYGVEREPQKVEYLTRRATRENVKNFTAVQSETAADAMPVSADLMLFADTWMILEVSGA